MLKGQLIFCAQSGRRAGWVCVQLMHAAQPDRMRTPRVGTFVAPLQAVQLVQAAYCRGKIRLWVHEVTHLEV